MSYRDWHVGMEVVMEIDPDLLAKCERAYWGAVFPKIGEVCVIRAIVDYADYGGQGLKLLLRGYDNTHMIPRLGQSIEPGFDIEFFRPVEKRKTDISVFTKLLNTKSVKELVQ